MECVFSGRKAHKKNIDVINSNNFAPALAGSLLLWFTSMLHVNTTHDVFSLCGKNYWLEVIERRTDYFFGFGSKKYSSPRYFAHCLASTHLFSGSVPYAW